MDLEKEQKQTRTLTPFSSPHLLRPTLGCLISAALFLRMARTEKASEKGNENTTIKKILPTSAAPDLCRCDLGRRDLARPALGHPDGRPALDRLTSAAPS